MKHICFYSLNSIWPLFLGKPGKGISEKGVQVQGIPGQSWPVQHPRGYLHSTKISFATLTALDAHAFLK